MLLVWCHLLTNILINDTSKHYKQDFEVYDDIQNKLHNRDLLIAI